MATNPIERAQWTGFLDEISRTHAGQQATVDAFGPGTGDHHEARALPFNGFEAETNHIVVMLGDKPGAHLSHTVSAPVQIWHKYGPDEPDEVIELRGEDGTTLVVRFQPVRS